MGQSTDWETNEYIKKVPAPPVKITTGKADTIFTNFCMVPGTRIIFPFLLHEGGQGSL